MDYQSQQFFCFNAQTGIQLCWVGEDGLEKYKLNFYSSQGTILCIKDTNQKLPQSNSSEPTWNLCSANVVGIATHVPAGVPFALEEQRGHSVTMFAEL